MAIIIASAASPLPSSGGVGTRRDDGNRRRIRRIRISLRSSSLPAASSSSSFPPRRDARHSSLRVPAARRDARVRVDDDDREDDVDGVRDDVRDDDDRRCRPRRDATMRAVDGDGGGGGGGIEGRGLAGGTTARGGGETPRRMSVVRRHPSRSRRGRIPTARGEGRNGWRYPVISLMTSGTTSRYGRTGYGGVVVVVRGEGGVGEEEEEVGGGSGGGVGVGNECNGTEQPYWTDLTTSSAYPTRQSN